MIKNTEEKNTWYNLATNATLNAKINEVKNKIPSITNVASTTALNAKIHEVIKKLPKTTNLVTVTALTAIENKLSNVTDLVKKTDYSIKISKIEKKVTTDHDHDKYIATQELILTTNLVVRSAQSNLRSKCDIADFIKNVASSKTKNVLVENELKEISTKRLTKDLTHKFSIFNVAKYFPSEIFQN